MSTFYTTSAGIAPLPPVVSAPPPVSDGNNGVATLTDFAATLVVGGRLVARVGGVLVPYDATKLSHYGALVGVALNTANPGQAVTVQAEGDVVVVGYGLLPDAEYFAGPGGTLLRSPSGVAFSQFIGRARSADVLLFNPQDSYVL